MTRTPTVRRPAWQAWATAQTAVAWVGLLAAVGVGFLGVALIASDAADDTDLWHGIGIAIGIVACLVGLVAGAVFEAVRRLTRSGVDRAVSGDPCLLRSSAWVGLTAVAVAAFAAVLLVGSVGVTSVALLAPLMIVAVPSIGILATAPGSR